MKRRWLRLVVLLGTGALLPFLPSCVEVYLLNIATPFLFSN